MQQLQFKVSELIADLSDKLTGHKLIISQSFKKLQFDIQFLNLENGLCFLSGKIISKEDVEFVQIAETNNDWTILYYLDQDINVSKRNLRAGIYTGFNNISYNTSLEANVELSIHVIIAHKDYLKIYNFLPIFDAIHRQENRLYYQTFSDPIVAKLKCFEKNMGRIKIKQNVFELITLFGFKEQRMDERLKKDIDTICQICMEQHINISMYLADKYRFEPNSVDAYFFEVFDTNINTYYQNFQLRAVRKILHEKENLNELLLINKGNHTPCIKQIIEKFDLKEKTFKQLFFEEFGESIYDYYRKLRLNIAKEYLLNKKMKVYQVSESLGYKHASNFIEFIQKSEGDTPRQLVLKQNRLYVVKEGESIQQLDSYY